MSLSKSTRFIHICAAGNGMNTLYALDEVGQVWRYYPSKGDSLGKVRYAFWGLLTTHRAEKDDQQA